MNAECDFRITYTPLFFAQGDDAYKLIEESDVAVDLQKFCENLVINYSPDELPEPIEGEAPAHNYRFCWHFKFNNKNYRFAYTTGWGGLFTLDMISYGDL